MKAKCLVATVVLVGCAPSATVVRPNDLTHIDFRAADAPPHEAAKKNEAWAIAGYVALGAFVTGFAVFVLLVLPQTPAGG